MFSDAGLWLWEQGLGCGWYMDPWPVGIEFLLVKNTRSLLMWLVRK